MGKYVYPPLPRQNGRNCGEVALHEAIRHFGITPNARTLKDLRDYTARANDYGMSQVRMVWFARKLLPGLTILPHNSVGRDQRNNFDALFISRLNGYAGGNQHVEFFSAGKTGDIHGWVIFIKCEGP